MHRGLLEERALCRDIPGHLWKIQVSQHCSELGESGRGTNLSAKQGVFKLTDNCGGCSVAGATPTETAFHHEVGAV